MYCLFSAPLWQVSGGEEAGTIHDHVDDEDSDDILSPDEDVQYHVDYEYSDDVSPPDEDVQLKPLKRKFFTYGIKFSYLELLLSL